MPELQDCAVSSLNILPEDTKTDIRTKVWDYLCQTGIALNTRPPGKRIFNFKGSEEAVERITSHDLFKNATHVRIDPDRPFLDMRYRTLKAGKVLLVPTPRLMNNVISKVVIPEDSTEETLRACAARNGMEANGQEVDLEEKVHVDLCIVGCVAVSPKGWRVGKGGGLSDLEYAMMASLNALEGNVPVITMVHDDQVIDMPDSLFGAHDVPVDFIFTPSRVIECTGKLPKPSGIMWNLLNEEKLKHVPVLKRIRFRQWKDQQDVKLADETSNPEELTDVVLPKREVPEGRRGDFKGRRRSFKKREEDGEATGDGDKRVRGENRRGAGADRRWWNRGRFGNSRGRRFPKRFSETEGRNFESDGHVDEEPKNRRRTRNSSGERQGDSSYEERRRRRPAYPMEPLEGALYVGAIPRTLRVSQFKSEIRDRNVNPPQVMWRGGMGFAFLNFRKQHDAEEALAALEGLHINDTALRIEMSLNSSPEESHRRRPYRRSTGHRRRPAVEEERE